MTDENPTPITQEELGKKLSNEESLAGVVIGNTYFSGRTFEKEVNFSDTIIQGKISFGSCKFMGETRVNFSEAQFSGDAWVDFSKAQFSDKAKVNFYKAKFSGDAWVDFSDAQFSDQAGAYFRKAQFSDRARAAFLAAQFSDSARASFIEAQFSGVAGADFSEARFKNISECLLINTILSSKGSFDFTNMRCADTVNVRFESVDLSEASFYLTDIEGFTFKNVTWGKDPKGFITRSVLKDEKLFKWIESEREKKKRKREREIDYFRQVEILYRQLKRNYEDKRDYHGARDFHFGELEMRRKQKTLLGQFTSLTLPYRWLSGYGEKWGRPLGWFFFMVLLFTYFNLNWIQPKNCHNTKAKITCSTWEQSDPISRYVDSSLFTFKLMTLQRNLEFEYVDDPIWERVGKIAFILQFLIGPTLIALMLLAIRRQFRR